MSSATKKEFKKSYNLFDSRPLSGDNLSQFYVDDYTKTNTSSIISTIEITEKYKKLLIIGQRGCGKSTVLNKVTAELRNNNYVVIKFSVSDDLYPNDVEALDILVAIYVRLLDSMKDRIAGSSPTPETESRVKSLLNKFLKPFKNIRSLAESFKIADIRISLFKILSVKMKIEADSREEIRNAFKNRVDVLKEGIESTVDIIEREDGKKKKREVILILDGLDKLESHSAERIFFEETDILTFLNVKTIYTFPLANFYSPAFVHISDRFTCEFIRLVSIYNMSGDLNIDSIEVMKKIVIKRIKTELISDEALQYLIEKSSGVLRDLIKFMQDVCKIAYDRDLIVIGVDTAKEAVKNKVNEYSRVFDKPSYKESILSIARSKTRENVGNRTLIHLLTYLFALEYGAFGVESWYDAHQCIKVDTKL